MKKLVEFMKRNRDEARAESATPTGADWRRKPTTFVVLTFVAGLGMGTIDEASAQEEDSAATTLYTSLLSGVSGSVTSAGVGWAMSAIGLAGGDGAELHDIANELAAIDQDLQAIEQTLVQLLNAIDNQTCVDTETQTSLTEAVDNITALFNTYQTDFVQTAQAGDPIIQSQVDSWMSAVLGSIEDNLTAIDDAVYGNPSNVITECVQSITQIYGSGDGPSENILDDRPYYAPILNTVNYYYGVQLQGASVLVEARHLQACQEAAKSDPDLHCDFSTVSTSTSATNAYAICQAPTGTVKTYCDEATEVVTDPESGTGTYERVLAQMKFAGAPYSNDSLGLLWNTSWVFPKSLQDFTNKATIDNKTVSNCSTLTSSDPCGLTVGTYDLEFNSGLSYGGYPADGESSIWNPAISEHLIALLESYNDKSNYGNIDTKGKLKDYMNSIGFDSTGDWIVTTATTGKNGDTGSKAICFMDTSAPRSDSEQPWCDASSDVPGTDKLLQGGAGEYSDASWTQDLASRPAFYNAYYENGKWKTKSGWLESAQETSDTDKQAKFWQYHWPVLDVTDLSCSARSQGNKNPGGEYTMCGSDLQAYIDVVMPPPSP